MLLRARNDAHYQVFEVTGRFSLERDEAASKAHLMAAVGEMQERFIAAKAKMGQEYIDGPVKNAMGLNGLIVSYPYRGFKVAGPFAHVAWSENVEPDPGPASMPDPRDRDAMRRWMEAEKSRTARKLSDRHPELVDFTLTGKFRARMRQQLLTMAPGYREEKSGLLVPAA